MKPTEKNKNTAHILRELERMTYERNTLLGAVFFIRKMARRVPDERAIFIEACDAVLGALKEGHPPEKRGKI